MNFKPWSGTRCLWSSAWATRPRFRLLGVLRVISEFLSSVLRAECLGCLGLRVKDLGVYGLAEGGAAPANWLFGLLGSLGKPSTPKSSKIKFEKFEA